MRPVVWKKHSDLENSAVESRQIEVMKALLLADMSDEVIAVGPPPIVSKRFDQRRAADRRARYERAAVQDICGAWPDSHTHLLGTTAILPTSMSHNVEDYLPKADVKAIHLLVERVLQRDRSIKLVTGAIEVDYCLKGASRYWQRTLHLSIVVVAADPDRAKEKVRKAFDLRANPLVTQPVQSTEITSPLGWIRYCFKSFSYGSVVRKSSYAADPLKGTLKGSRKQSLQKPEREAMLRSMAQTRWSSLRVRAVQKT